MLYPDIAMRAGDVPPSVIEAEALAWIAPLKHRWTPDHDARMPADVLAVIGALVLSAARHEPLGWDGQSLRGPDPVALIHRLAIMHGVVKERLRVHIGWDSEIALSLPAPEASRLWGGRVTIQTIWESNQRSLAALVGVATDLRGTLPEDAPAPLTITMATRLDAGTLRLIRPYSGQGWTMDEIISPSATGYDSAIVGDALRDGFSAAAQGMRIIGARPCVELYSLIGAMYLEAQGRWPRPSRPSIPPIAGVVLRDRYDLDRHLMLCARELPVEYRMSGKRGYLEAA